MLEDLKKRELRFGELLFDAWVIFRNNIKTILFINILIFFPLCLVENLFSLKMQPIIEFIDQASTTGFGNMVDFLWAYRQYMLHLIALLILCTVIVPLGKVAIAKMVENHLYGKEFHYKDVVLFAVERGPSIIWISLFANFFIIMGSMMLILPGVYLALHWVFYEYEIALGREKGIAALKESSQVTIGRKGKIFMYLVIFVVLSFLIPSSRNTFGVSVFLGVLGYVMQSFFMVFWSVYYLNLKLIENKFLVTETEERSKMDEIIEETNRFVEEERKPLEGDKKYPWEQKEGYSSNHKDD